MPTPESDQLLAWAASLETDRRTNPADFARFRALIAARLRNETTDDDRDELAAALDETIGPVEEGGAPSGVLVSREPGSALTVPFPGLDAPRVSAALEHLGVIREPGGRGLRYGVLPAALVDGLVLEATGADVVTAPAGSVRREGNAILLELSEPGTIWLDVSLFGGSSAGRPAWAAFAVANARGRFAAAATGLRIATPVAGELKLGLGYPGEVEVCEGVSIAPPESISLRWDGRGNVEVTLGQGRASVGTAGLEFEGNGSVVVDRERARLVLGADVSSDTVSFDALPHRVATLAGSGTPTNAGWAVPIARFGPIWPTLEPSGGWLIHLAGEAGATWAGLAPQEAVGMPDPWLELALHGWTLGTKRDASEHRFSVSAWPVPGGGQPLEVGLEKAGAIGVGCDRVNGDFVAFGGVMAGPLSRPIGLDGAPYPLQPTHVSAVLTEGGDAVRRLSIRRVGGGVGAPIRFAIENALLETKDGVLSAVDGVLTGGTRLTAGTLRLTARLTGWMPILPDPYVANIEPGFPRRRERPITVTVSWDSDAPSVAFAGALDAGVLQPMREAERAPRPAPAKQNRQPRRGLTASGRQTRGPREARLWREAARRAADAQGSVATAKAIDRFDRLTERDRDLRLRLLDVSTRRDQVGVELAVASSGRVRLSGQRVLVELDSVRVFCLPQVQWEPVRTLDADQDIATLGYFPTPLASADDGGATRIASPGSRLAAAIPDLAVAAILDNFADGAEMRVLTSLPFGIKALMELRAGPHGDQEADRAVIVRPEFEGAAPMRGGLQLAVTAGEYRSSVSPRPGPDPAFEGATVQTLNGVDLASGTPLERSVLAAEPRDDSVESMFNEEFALSRPKVPVKRLDISGYGASTFSDWKNRDASFAEAGKVEFQVIVGRTSLEVVKFVSEIYPYKIRATRTVTIERGAGAGVLRRDSGWQAASDGFLDTEYRVDTSGGPIRERVEVHPGLIRGIYDVHRIRPADRPAITLSGGGRVMPITFDATLDVGTRATNRRVPFSGVLGYLHLAPVGEPIELDELVELIDVYGAPGGRLDTGLELDGSGFRCRLVRAEVAVARDGSARVLCGSVHGIPRFGKAGAWTVVAFPTTGDPTEPAEPEQVDDGLPIIRFGPTDLTVSGELRVPAFDPEIRFADASDLFRPRAPGRDFAFLQTTPTHVFAFRRPVLDASGPHIESSLPAHMADILARSLGSGLFPPLEDAIELPSGLALSIDRSTGALGLQAPGNSLSMRVTRGPLLMGETEMGDMQVDYGEASLELVIGPNDWSLDLRTLRVQMTIVGVVNAIGVEFDVLGGLSRRNRMENMFSLVGADLMEVLRPIGGLEERRSLPSIDLDGSNDKAKYKWKAATKFGGKISVAAGSISLSGSLKLEQGAEELAVPEDELPPGVDKIQEFTDFIGGALGLAVRGQFQVGTGVYFVVGAGLEVGIKYNWPVTVEGETLGGELKPTMEVRLELGAAFGGDVAGIEALSTVLAIFLYRVEGSTPSLGIGVRAELKLKLWEILEVLIYLEALGVVTLEPDGDYLSCSAEVGIQVKFCGIFSISFSGSATVKDKIS